MYVEDSYALYERLKSLELLKESPPFWWPEYGSFEVVIGVILTQNTSWKNVERSLENLRVYELMTMEALITCNLEALMLPIAPSGFYRNKSKYLKTLAVNITESFGGFEDFCAEVSREWLLEQKGVGPESADSILCYACKRAEMVVDSYTHRLVSALGYEFESYDELKQWCENLHGNFSDEELPKVYAEFHGMIVEYMKRYSSRKGVEIVF